MRCFVMFVTAVCVLFLLNPFTLVKLQSFSIQVLYQLRKCQLKIEITSVIFSNGSWFKYRAKLVQAFAFQPVRQESDIFRFECIKACLRHDLSRHVESARLVT